MEHPLDVVQDEHVPWTLAVVEVFGPTIQGEGPAAGRLAWFVRLGGCNLSCSWCDTPYTWDRTRYSMREQIKAMAVDEIVDGIPPRSLVVITGGEPLLQQDRAGWRELLSVLRARACEIHVETNGTIAPNAASQAVVQLWAVSPKLPNAGTHKTHQDPALHRGWRPAVLRGDAHLKVVCADASDVARARVLAAHHAWPVRQVWVMPEGTSPEALAASWPEVAEAAAVHGVNASHRLHVLAWGDERGH
jgi:7-cyano-7-deazaguanosine (preQ0) biosynthesis protein QueE